MMKVAIAGTNGFAQYLAHYLQATTPHQFIILSRRPNPGLTAKGWQIIQAKYDSASELTYLLTGVDVVFSTISGTPQITLIDAAAAANVRIFVPSEFRGSPTLCPPSDVLDDGRAEALERLDYHASKSSMQYTIFTCGVFFERFAPGGLATSQIDVGRRLGGEGDFLVDLRKCRASVPRDVSPFIPSHEEDTYICMISARDAARYVIASLELQVWPRELKFRAERLRINELVSICQRIRGLPFQTRSYTLTALDSSISQARAEGDSCLVSRLTQQLRTAKGEFNFTDTNLDLLVDVSCETFEEWLSEAWKSVL